MRTGVRDRNGQIVGERLELSSSEVATVLDALNVRALDRQADEYGDGEADNAADLYRRLSGAEPNEAESIPQD